MCSFFIEEELKKATFSVEPINTIDKLFFSDFRSIFINEVSKEVSDLCNILLDDLFNLARSRRSFDRNFYNTINKVFKNSLSSLFLSLIIVFMTIFINFNNNTRNVIKTGRLNTKISLSPQIS